VDVFLDQDVNALLKLANAEKIVNVVIIVLAEAIVVASRTIQKTF